MTQRLPLWQLGIITLLFIAAATFITLDYRIALLVAAAGLLGSSAFLALNHAQRLPLFIMLGLIAGQIARLKLSSDGAGALLLMDVVTGGYVVAGALHAVLAKKRIPTSLAFIFLFGFTLWIGVSLLFGAGVLTGRELLVAAFYTIRFILMTGVLWVTASLFTQEQHNRLTTTLITSGIIITLLGFGQLVFFPDFAFMTQYGWDPHEGRLLSTFFDPNFLGMFLVMIASLLTARIITGHTAVTPVNIGWLLLVIAAILLTFSRSSYLALLVAFTVIFLLRAWKYVLIGGVILAVGAFSIPRVKERIIGAFQVDATAQDRLESWQQTGVIIREHPIVGVGYNAFGPAQLRLNVRQTLTSHAAQGSDSSLLLVLATTGGIGLFLYLGFLSSLYLAAWIRYTHHSSLSQQSLSLALIGIMPSYIIHSQFVNGLFYPLLLVPFMLLAAGVLTSEKH